MDVIVYCCTYIGLHKERLQIHRPTFKAKTHDCRTAIAAGYQSIAGARTKAEIGVGRQAKSISNHHQSNISSLRVRPLFVHPYKGIMLLRRLCPQPSINRPLDVDFVSQIGGGSGSRKPKLVPNLRITPIRLSQLT